MNLILLGAPGAGKGTQASLLCEKLNVPHISTGDIFRKNIKEQTPIGIVAKGYIDKGQLVPDEVTVEIVRQRLKDADCANGFMLDGFPRTVEQAKALAEFAKIDVVINIEIPLERLLRRLTGRRVCAKCGESYHIDFLNGETKCSKCGGELYQRADDNEQTVNQRLEVYTKQTAPLISFYNDAKILKNVNGDLSASQVLEEIMKVL